MVDVEFHCSKCDQPIAVGQGIRMLTVGQEEELFYCKSCLRGAMNMLGMKKHKTPDEIKLLTAIRKFLRHVKN